MRIKRHILPTISLFACFVISIAHATDLMDVYKDAFANDPKFKAAHSHWLAAKEGLAISRADLLPQLSATSSFTRTRSERDSATNALVNPPSYSNTSGYTLKLTQSIFNFQTWANVWGTQAAVYKEEASYLAAKETLLQRIAEAYFNVLMAKDILIYAQAKKAAMLRMFTQTKHKYDVGLIPVADLENARANYDAALSEEIGANNDVNITLEKLSELTKIKYIELAPVKSNLPLLTPRPAAIDAWVKAAEKQNLELSAVRYDALSARENIKMQTAGHLPTVDAQVSHTYQYHDKYSYQNTNTSYRTKDTAATIQLGVPLFQGGKTVAAVRQADYQYQEKLQTQEKTHREVVSKTRQAYLSILSSISKIHADLQAIKSAASYLRAAQASYAVGAKSTLADVLDAQSKVYEAQKTFAKDQYSYITQFLALKALTGSLGVEDLQQFNTWLGYNTQTNITKKSTNKAATTQPVKKHVQAKPKITTSSTVAALSPSKLTLSALEYTSPNTIQNFIVTKQKTSNIANNEVVVLKTEQVVSAAKDRKMSSWQHDALYRK